jgi:hypothetical protein
MRGRTSKLQLQQYCRFGLGLDRLLIGLLVYSCLHFLISISTGQDQQQIPALSQMQTVNYYCAAAVFWWTQFLGLETILLVAAGFAL